MSTYRGLADSGWLSTGVDVSLFFPASPAAAAADESCDIAAVGAAAGPEVIFLPHSAHMISFSFIRNP